MGIPRAGWVVAAGACALPLASVLHSEFSIALMGMVAALTVLAGVRPLWALCGLAALGPLALPLLLWLGHPPISGNEMLEMLVLAVVCGVGTHHPASTGDAASAAGPAAAW